MNLILLLAFVECCVTVLEVLEVLQLNAEVIVAGSHCFIEKLLSTFSRLAF